MEKTNKNKAQLIGSIILVIVFFLAVVFLGGNANKNIIKEDDSQVDLPLTENDRDKGNFVLNENDRYMGNKNAEVIILEYSDTECPFCKKFHETMNQVVKNRGNEILWVYRHYPIKSKSYMESMATECAFEQKGNEGFWQYINTLYEITPSNDQLPEEELYNIANGMSLDINQFTSCMKEERFKDKITQDFKQGGTKEVEGTPTSFIIKNGEIVNTIPGAQPYEEIISAIDRYTR